MASKYIIRDGNLEGVYDDEMRPIFEALGVMTVNRASEVEFEPETGDWVAHLLPPTQKRLVASGGKVKISYEYTEIARGKNRGDVIKAEVAYLEREMKI